MRENEKNTAIYVAYEDAVPFDPAAPEKNLLRAVLLSAMLDLKKPGDPGRKALEYFLSPDEDYVFSFASICTFLNVDQDKILAVTGLKPGIRGDARFAVPIVEAPAVEAAPHGATLEPDEHGAV